MALGSTVRRGDQTMILRTILAVLIITAGALVLAGFLSMCEAKQEPARPERPVLKAEKPLPAEAEACKPPVMIQFWVSGNDGKLKLAGYTILPGTCTDAR